MRQRIAVIGAPIDALDPRQALAQIAEWASRRESRYVCICNVHSVVSALQRTDFARAVHEADMATPDGAPVAWMMRRLGATGQPRVSGPDLMLAYCADATLRGEAIYLFGSTPETLATLEKRLTARWPTLKIAGSYSPPFGPISPEEDKLIIDQINRSGAGTVWVSLGCPKQELWMAQHRGQINAVMIGVGAAFDFHAGTITRAPEWMQNSGLEWLHRLLSEPGRLWRRYLVTNTTFIIAAGRQLLLRFWR